MHPPTKTARKGNLFYTDLRLQDAQLSLPYFGGGDSVADGAQITPAANAVIEIGLDGRLNCRV